MLTVVYKLAGCRIIEGTGASTQPWPALEDRDLQATIGQGRRSRQARQSATHDRDMGSRRTGCSLI